MYHKNNSDYTIINPEQGITSTTLIINDLFLKFVHKNKIYEGVCNNFEVYDLYKREKYLASILNKFNWYPQLVYSYDEKELLIYKNCGLPLNKNNCPDNIILQINKILDDLDSVNIQHNDIKQDELIVDNYGKVYLCDFGWGSVNNNFNCGIDIWGDDNKNKPGGWLNDKDVIERLNIKDMLIYINTYIDPKRNIGYQSETPELIIKDNKVIVTGYQIFDIDVITKQITLKRYVYKFSYLNGLLNKLRNEGCISLVDIGCSAGLTSLIAHINNFEYIVSLDHDPEYIETLSSIKKYTSINNINEGVFKFGDSIDEKYDVVFCGAIIHWVFSLTADFRNFDSIISYLCDFTKKYLIIEWVDQNDAAISILNHIKKGEKSDDEEYNTENFTKVLKKYTEIISMEPINDNNTRVIYVLKKV